jgi:ABC-type polysaccharide/polyol phosphate export permease
MSSFGGFSTLFDMRGSGIENFSVYLLIGQLLFNFFNEGTGSAMGSMLSAAPLIKKVYIPKYIFPLERVCFALVNCLFSFIALVIVMLVTGAKLHDTVLLAFIRC